jgi:hypothetical protein
MSLRRKLFGLWCGLTVFDGHGALLLLKFQVGGWRAAYVQLAITLLMGVGTPLIVLLIGRAAFWMILAKSELGDCALWRLLLGRPHVVTYGCHSAAALRVSRSADRQHG